MNTPPLVDADLERLQALLDALPPPLEPLDVSALDGMLCGVLLQPKPVPTAAWLKWVTDVEGREPPAGPALAELQALVLRRHAEIDRAIARRDWFDPWVFALDDDEQDDELAQADGGGGNATAPSVLPWVAGFAAAMDAFPDLMAMDEPALIEPLALLYLHFPPEDLEDADALQAVIETLEPPADLGEAVQDMVRALMLMADVTRPRAAPPGLRPRGAARRPGGAGSAGRVGPARGRR